MAADTFSSPYGEIFLNLKGKNIDKLEELIQTFSSPYGEIFLNPSKITY